MSERYFIDTTPGVGYPELRAVVPATTWHRGATLMGARPEPAPAPPARPKSYREQLAERIARTPFTPGALEVLLREFSPWREGTPVERILRAGRSDEDVELFTRRLEEPFLYLPGELYRQLVALKQIRARCST
jgi:hypothetical protein